MNTWTRAAVTIFSTACALAAMSSPAEAQDRDRNSGIIVFDDVETIEGEIEKPEAYYILSPSNLNYESVDAEASFLDRMYETVEEPAF